MVCCCQSTHAHTHARVHAHIYVNIHALHARTVRTARVGPYALYDTLCTTWHMLYARAARVACMHTHMHVNACTYTRKDACTHGQHVNKYEYMHGSCPYTTTHMLTLTCTVHTSHRHCRDRPNRTYLTYRALHAHHMYYRYCTHRRYPWMHACAYTWMPGCSLASYRCIRARLLNQFGQ